MIFRAVRIKKRWRQQDVAVRARVTRAAVSRLERGHASQLGLDELVRIAEALDVSLKITATWRGSGRERINPLSSSSGSAERLATVTLAPALNAMELYLT